MKFEFSRQVPIQGTPINEPIIVRPDGAHKPSPLERCRLRIWFLAHELASIPEGEELQRRLIKAQELVTAASLLLGEEWENLVNYTRQNSVASIEQLEGQDYSVNRQLSVDEVSVRECQSQMIALADELKAFGSNSDPWLTFVKAQKVVASAAQLLQVELNQYLKKHGHS